jgi:uncharacterized protein YndB with AHSA1/START domain
MTTTETAVLTHRVFIKASAERIWAAIVSPEWSRRYGYRAVVSYDLRPGGDFAMLAGDHMPGMEPTAVVVTGEVVEADAPHRLIHTWRSAWIEECATRVTWEIREVGAGVCSLTVRHDVVDAPLTAAQFNGDVDGAGGGWPEVISDLKSLLETGTGMYA